VRNLRCDKFIFEEDNLSRYQYLLELVLTAVTSTYWQYPTIKAKNGPAMQKTDTKLVTEGQPNVTVCHTQS